MAKSGFAEIGEYNPRQDCTFKKKVDEKGNSLREHIGTDGTAECSLEAKYGAVDPFSSMGYFTTTCRNHMEVPKKIMAGMAELHRAFPEDNQNLSDEKSRVDHQVERQRIDDPEVEQQRKLREQWDNERSKHKDTNSNSGSFELDVNSLFD
jgi:hypothetical protein